MLTVGVVKIVLTKIVNVKVIIDGMGHIVLVSDFLLGNHVVYNAFMNRAYEL